MKFAATSDLHGDLPKIEECDALLICGDLSPVLQQRDHEAMTEWMTVVFNDWVNKLPCDKVFLIAGNHDFWMEASKETPILWNSLSSFVSGKLIVLDNQLYDYKGIKIYGTPDCQWISKHWAYMNGDVELNIKYKNIPENLDILMTHQAPYAYGMGTSFGSKWRSEFGSFSLANAIVDKKPKYAICGHIHSGEHRPQIKGATTYVNVSYKDENYSPAYNVFYFEIFDYIEEKYTDVAKKIMETIQYDNGAINRLEEAQYPEKWIYKIAKVAEVFFKNNPDKLNDDDIEAICADSSDNNLYVYGDLIEYGDLIDTLNEYFEEI